MARHVAKLPALLPLLMAVMVRWERPVCSDRAVTVTLCESIHALSLAPAPSGASVRSFMLFLR